MLAEDETDHGHLAFRTKLAHDILKADQLCETVRFEARRVRPKIEHGIDLALLGSFVEKRRRAEFLGRVSTEIEIRGPKRIGDDQEPTLVEWAAGDTELLPLEVGERFDGRVGGHHDSAERRGEGNEGEVGAAGTLARHP